MKDFLFFCIILTIKNKNMKGMLFYDVKIKKLYFSFTNYDDFFGDFLSYISCRKYKFQLSIPSNKF